MAMWSTVDLPHWKPTCSWGSSRSNIGSTHVYIRLFMILKRTHNKEISL